MEDIVGPGITCANDRMDITEKTSPIAGIEDGIGIIIPFDEAGEEIIIPQGVQNLAIWMNWRQRGAPVRTLGRTRESSAHTGVRFDDTRGI